MESGHVEERNSFLSSEEEFIEFDASKLEKDIHIDHGAAPSPLKIVVEDRRLFSRPSTTTTQSSTNQEMDKSDVSNQCFFFCKEQVSTNEESSNLALPMDLFPPSTLAPLDEKNKGSDLLSPVANKATNITRVATMNGVLGQIQEGRRAKISSPSSECLPRCLESMNSNNSFAFPILADGKIECNQQKPEDPKQLHQFEEQQQEFQPQPAPNKARICWVSCFSCCPFR